MIRIPYMNDLINHLRLDPPIIAAGLDKTILVYSEWTIEKLTRDWEYGIVIQPLRSTVISNVDRRTGCKSNMDSELIIAVQVKDVSSTQQHFDIDEQVPNWQVVGAYPAAAAFEEIVRTSIGVFNNNLQSASNLYDPLTLLELQEPEESNGFLILKQLYKTRFIF